MRRLQLRDRICVKDLDGKFDQYERSINPAERRSSPRRSSARSWKTITWCPCSVTRSSTRSAPGRGQKWQDIFPTITTGYAYPWEDLKVKE